MSLWTHDKIPKVIGAEHIQFHDLRYAFAALSLKNRGGRKTVIWGCRATIRMDLEMSRNVQSGNTQNLKSTVIQRSFPKWSVAERRKTAAASDQAAVCACTHSRYFAGGSPIGLRV